MTPEHWAVNDDGRDAAALILAITEDRDDDIAVILGCEPAHHRLAGVAYRLARLLVIVAREYSGLDPGDVARALIETADSSELRDRLLWPS